MLIRDACRTFYVSSPTELQFCSCENGIGNLIEFPRELQ